MPTLTTLYTHSFQNISFCECYSPFQTNLVGNLSLVLECGVQCLFCYRIVVCFNVIQPSGAVIAIVCGPYKR